MTGPGTDITPQGGDKLQKFVLILSNAITLLANPLIGGDKTPKIAAMVQFARTLLLNADSTYQEMEEVDAEIQKLVNEGRGPTDEEWAPWDARLNTGSGRIEKVGDSLTP